MAYGLYLYKQIINQGDRVVRLEIYQKDYVGASIEIDSLQSATLVMDNQGEDLTAPIIKSSLNFTLVNTNQFNYEVFFTPDATKFKVVYKLDGVAEWTGYLTPDSYTENLSYRDTISLVARDNLGLLEQIKYKATTYSYERLGYIFDTMDYLLAQINFPMVYEWSSNKVSGSTNIKDALINIFVLEQDDKSCFEVLKLLLKSFALQMRYVGGNKYQIIDINDFISRPTTQDVIFLNGATREIIPAWKDSSLQFQYNKLDNFYRGYLREASDYTLGGQVTGQDYDWSIPNYSNRPEWAFTLNPLRLINPIPYFNNPNWLYITGIYDGNASPSYNDRMTYLAKVEKSTNAMRFTFKAQKELYQVINPSTIYRPRVIVPAFPIFGRGWPNIQLRMKVELLGVTNNYILDQYWQLADTYTGDGMIIFTYSGRTEDNAGTQDISIEMQTIPEDGVLNITFYPYELFDYTTFEIVNHYDVVVSEKRIYNPLLLSEIRLECDNNGVSEGIDQSVVINADANIKGDIQLDISEVIDDYGGANMFGNGLFVGNVFEPPIDSVSPLIGWKWLGGTTYPLYELCARQIIHNNYSQKNKYTGSFIVDKDKLTAPSFNSLFIADNKNCVLNYGSLNLLTEEMNAELIEVYDYNDVTLTFTNTNKNWEL